MPTYVLSGDITRRTRVDAIVTLINSGRMWFGGVDGAIQRVAGQHYHNQARAASLSNGEVIIAKCGSSQHQGSFDDVIFVVDDLVEPLSGLVSMALVAAHKEGYQRIALPLFRTGVMLGAVENTVLEVVNQMKMAINDFIKKYGDEMTIIIVIYDDPSVVSTFIQDGSIFKGS